MAKPVNKFLFYLWTRRVVIYSSSAIIFVGSVIFTFFMLKPEYKSEVTFLPPSEGTATAVTLMGLILPGGTSIMYDQVEIVFNSAALKRRMIEKFNFYERWKIAHNPDRFEAALKKIGKYVMFKSKEKGSMGFEKIVSYTVSCYHPSPDTAKLMCDFAFSIVDSSVKTLSTGMAHRNRMFVEDQLSLHKTMLDSLQLEFKTFQLANKAFVVPEQMKLSLKNYAEIKSSAIMNELRMNALRQEFHGTVPELEELRRNDRLYNQKLTEIETDSRLDVLPSLQLSAKLLPEYSNLSRETEVQNQVIILLSRELEQARVQESRNISLLTVIDPPFVPFRKARPKRLFTMALIFISLHLAIFVMFGYRFYFSSTFMNSEFTQSLLQAIKSSKR